MKVTAGEVRKINLMPATKQEEIVQNLSVLLDTPKGSVPLGREIGVSWDSIDRPMPFGAQQFTIDATEAAQDFEPRVQIREADYVQMNSNGYMKAVLEVSIEDE